MSKVTNFLCTASSFSTFTTVFTGITESATRVNPGKLGDHRRTVNHNPIIHCLNRCAIVNSNLPSARGVCKLTINVCKLTIKYNLCRFSSRECINGDFITFYFHLSRKMQIVTGVGLICFLRKPISVRVLFLFLSHYKNNGLG